MGPAIIQALAKQHDMASTFIDVNLELQELLETDPSKDKILSQWCTGLESTLTNQEQQLLGSLVDSILPKNFNDYDLLSISVFSMHSHAFTTWFLQHYRSVYTGKIVIGGAGVGTPDQVGETYGSAVLKKNLIDYYIVGEGEYAWQAVVTDTLPYKGVNSELVESLENFDDIPLPDYTGYDLARYYNSKARGITIGVEGSRGCVRNCTFCDIKSFWKKYKYKDGAKLASELIMLKEKYSVEHFFFNDSLINGSDRAFRDFITVLADYNKTHEQRIKWSAYYIIKQASTYKEQDWINLKNSGVQALYIGIESGSESVREHMKKKFSDEDIEHAMNKIQRYGIHCTWLMIIGYPTETQADFEKTLDMLTKYQHMAVDRTIDTLALGLTLNITEGSPLGHMKDELNIQSVIQDHYGGVYWKTDANDFETRLAWRIQAEKLVRELGYNSWVGDNDVVQYFEKRLEDIQQGKITNYDIADIHG